MEPLPTLTKGLEILGPFLKRQDFEFDNYENAKGLGEQFTVVTYKKGSKKFILSYLPCIGQIDYQFENSKAYHDFYLEQLGVTDKKKFKGFKSDDTILPFTHILHDFEFLIDDFFQGQCIKLKKISALQDSILAEYQKKTREEFSVQFDKIRIETARQEFRKKDFKKSASIYRKIENINMFGDLDKKIIEFCERHS